MLNNSHITGLDVATICHLGWRRRQLGWSPGRIGRQAGRGVLLLSALVAIVCGCGELHFVPSPYTPQDVELVFSTQENITVIRWRVSAGLPVSDTRFELRGADGSFTPIDFASSVFPGGVNACKDGKGSCAQYVVRGEYPAVDGDHPVRAVHTTYGVLPGGPATTSTMSETLTVESFFHVHNDLVYANMKDAVAADGPYDFPRTYERAMWATSGLCVSDTAPDGVSFSSLDASGAFPPVTPLTDAGIYCVAARPLPSDGGDRAMAQTRVATVPEVVTGQQLFDPPVERAPIIYQIILDLQIPVPDRCASAISTIENLVAGQLSQWGVQVVKLPTINLSQAGDGAEAGAGCAQVDEPTVNAAQIADAVQQTVKMFPEVHQQFHLLYFNNLNALLPQSLTTSLQALFDDLGPPPGYDLMTISWLFNPPGATANLTWTQAIHWFSADDPSFVQSIDQLVNGTFPYETQVHDPTEPVLLLSNDDVAAYAGDLVKICSASPSIEPVSQHPSIHQIVGPSWMIDAADPPAYLVNLPVQADTPAETFVEASALVGYQICTRYCTDHPYLTEAGTGVTSWTNNVACTSKDY
jgi:hypothetical protein